MDLTNTILLVSSRDCKNFGTGFVVHEDKEKSYIATCAHVVQDIEAKSDQILVGRTVAEVIAIGKPDEIALAILTVEKIPKHKPLHQYH